MSFTAFVSWPSAPLTESLVRRSLALLDPSLRIVNSLSDIPDGRILQWSSYDEIDHELTHANSTSVLSSSYTIRKALIRKHFLHRCIHAYVTKHPDSLLRCSVPQTWDIDISFADELDEMWADELWDLNEDLTQSGGAKWFILKPGMADRGMGIRLFNSKEALQSIFESFDEESDEEKPGDETDDDTGVVASQLRHFVIQEYISKPVLLDPNQIPIDSTTPVPQLDALQGYKFHLRVYCVAAGDLTVHMCPRILALFSSRPYALPSASCNSDGAAERIDLLPHLTNTCLQRQLGEQGVRLFQELAGCYVLSAPVENMLLMESDIRDVVDRIADILAETFRAGLQFPVHFQPVPNAFELFGVDFLLSHETPAKLQEEGGGRFRVNLLEINAEPAIEMTGPRLRWVLEELFEGLAEEFVAPFFAQESDGCSITSQKSTTKLECYLRKCLDTQRHVLS